MDHKLRFSLLLGGTLIAVQALAVLEIYEAVRVILLETIPLGSQFDASDPRLTKTLPRLRNVLILTLAVTSTLTFVLSYFFAKLMLLPFSRLSKVTSRLDVERLSVRFPDRRGPHELKSLVTSFNQLLDRLQQSFLKLSRFSTFTSHELRTPLTVIRGEVEWLLSAKRTDSETNKSLTKLLTNTEHLQAITTRLLSLAQVEKCHPKQRVNLEIDSFVRALADNVSATNQTQRKIRILGAETIVCVHPELLSSIVSNLIENAVKYSRSRVIVLYDVFDEKLELVVEDDGEGVPPESLAQLGEPFFRIKPEIKNGHGLGLAIVKACAQASQGSVTFERASLGGLRARVLLPA